MAHRSKVVQRHWDRVAGLPCCVSGCKPVTLHHCHGGSMLDVGVRKGFRKTSDWLVIPLAPDFHCTGGLYAIDGSMGVVNWEAQFGTQVSHLDALCKALGYNVWLLAGVQREVALC